MTNNGRGRWPAVAAAGIGTLVALVAVVLVVNRSPGAPKQAPAPPVATGAADPAALVVDDGDVVEASGRVIAAPGKPARFCAPAPVPAIGRVDDAPPQCATGVDVTGVDAAKLADATVVKGVTVGQARLRGTWKAGVLHVTTQGPPVAAAQPAMDDSVPCATPKGGWKPGGGADSNAMHDYIYERHPDQFRPLRVAYPDGPPTGVTTGPQPTEVTVVEVVAGDVAKEEEQLRKLFDGNLCVVSAPGRPSIARQEQLRDQVSAGLDPLMSDPASGIWSVGGDDVFTVELMMLTPKLFEQLRAIGFDLLRVEPWLRPTVER
ncbi:hypothetical protein OHA72_32485 [Dactylosporangium sp. NBC_01737]|uniref:hypothetical protein n=1 Tax=Dactylosporangium sp. NBC_01737 TaxID=2975959 RepID=UPI002E14F1AC|nr:hypothetical protein OHA72_32485 [Dactylosporangium sp. NBC_01737]